MKSSRWKDTCRMAQKWVARDTAPEKQDGCLSKAGWGTDPTERVGTGSHSWPLPAVATVCITADLWWGHETTSE